MRADSARSCNDSTPALPLQCRHQIVLFPGSYASEDASSMQKNCLPLVIAFWVCQIGLPIAIADEPSVKKKSPAYWATQLSHPHYLRREAAHQKLIQAGPAAVDLLSNVLRNGDLEAIERASSVLTEIAVTNHPSKDGGAWQVLSDLSANSTGVLNASASRSAGEIRAQRSARAMKELSAANVFVGEDEFMIRAISQRKLIVEVDQEWSQNVDALEWLRWLDGFQNARISGPALRGDVLSRVIQMPELESLAIANGELSLQELQVLEKLSEIRTLEVRYVALNAEQVDLIASLPIRDSITLLGTGITEPQIDSMRATMPGVTIDAKMGGFLGVKCQDVLAQCEISEVVRDSAAEEGGLIPRDVILQIGDAKIEQFSDLQKEIGRHPAGKTLPLTFRRANKIENTTVTLRQFVES